MEVGIGQASFVSWGSHHWDFAGHSIPGFLHIPALGRYCRDSNFRSLIDMHRYTWTDGSVDIDRDRNNTYTWCYMYMHVIIYRITYDEVFSELNLIISGH